MTVKIESKTETLDNFCVVATKYVVGGPWWCKVVRTTDNEEFSLQRFSYATAEAALAVGRKWAAETIANRSAGRRKC